MATSPNSHILPNASFQQQPHAYYNINQMAATPQTPLDTASMSLIQNIQEDPHFRALPPGMPPGAMQSPLPHVSMQGVVSPHPGGGGYTSLDQLDGVKPENNIPVRQHATSGQTPEAGVHIPPIDPTPGGAESMMWNKTAISSTLQECQSLATDENTLRQTLILKLTELKKCQTWLQQQSNPAAGVTPVSQQIIQQCEQEIKRYSDEVLQLYQELSRKRQTIITKLHHSCTELERLYAQYYSMMLDWRRHQKIQMIGVPFADCEQRLDELQRHVEYLADQAWKIRIEAANLQDHLTNPSVQDPGIHKMAELLSQIIASVKGFLQRLVSGSFIVSGQPQPVLKKDKTFNMDVRLLIGGKLGRYLSPKISARIISAEDATQLKNNQITLNDMLAKKAAGSIIGVGDQQLTFHEERQHLVAKFEQIKISMEGRRAARGPGRRDDTVANTKYCFLFTSSFLFGTAEDNVDVSIHALSLPVVVTVHHSQDRDSHATIFWEYAFSDIQNDAVAEEAYWPKFAELLKWRFKDFTRSNRDLNDNELIYLGEKLLGPGYIHQNAANLIVTRSKVFQDKMRQDLDFTFWKWFYEIMDLIRTRLKDFWDDNMIFGFISKDQCAEMLRSAGKPSLMIRFSDSIPGCVSLSFMPADVDPMSMHVEPVNLMPFSAKDLETMPLPERVSTCPSLQRIEYIYPNRSKQELLRYAKNNAGGPARNGYAAAKMVMVVQDDHGNSDTDSIQAHTPSSMPNQFSPADASIEAMEATSENMYGDLMSEVLSNAASQHSMQGAAPVGAGAVGNPVAAGMMAPDPLGVGPHVWQALDQVMDGSNFGIQYMGPGAGGQNPANLF